MTLGLCFWVVVLVTLLFSAFLARKPEYAPYAPFPVLLLIVLLGWQVFGPALHR